MLRTLRSPHESAVEEGDFRDALRRFASGVTVITAPDGDGGVHAMTATAFSSLSLKPPLVLVALAREARCHRLILAHRRFGVSILHAHQVQVSRHFGKQGEATATPRFVESDGMPVIEDALATLACTLERTADGGDHSIFIGLVTKASARSGTPLIHFDGRYRGLDDEA